MTEVEHPRTIELGAEEQKRFLSAINSMPESGIALRGDPLGRASELKLKGLLEPQINFIVFTPPEVRPKVWGKDAEVLFRQLSSAVGMALVYADPWYDTGARTTITDKDFVGFSDYFEHHPDQLPSVTWFTEAEAGQFDKVRSQGRTWADYEITHRTGDVASFGEVPAEDIKPPITLTLEEIQSAQDVVVKNQKAEIYDSTSQKKKQKKKWPRIRRRRETAPDTISEIDLLRRGRFDFRSELREIVTKRLVEQMVEDFVI